MRGQIGMTSIKTVITATLSYLGLLCSTGEEALPHSVSKQLRTLQQYKSLFHASWYPRSGTSPYSYPRDCTHHAKRIPSVDSSAHECIPYPTSRFRWPNIIAAFQVLTQPVAPGSSSLYPIDNAITRTGLVMNGLSTTWMM